jgi:YVTN family beta-propeller protein
MLGRLVKVAVATSVGVLVLQGCSAGGDSLPADVTVGRDPTAIAVSRDGLLAYVTNRGSRSVSVIDLTSRKVRVTIDVNGTLSDIAVAPDGRTAYVACSNAGGGVGVLDTTANTFVKSVGRSSSLSQTTTALVLSPDGKTVYAVGQGEDGLGSITVIDTAAQAVRTVIPVHVKDQQEIMRGTYRRLYDAAFAPDGRTVYVAAYSGDPGTSDFAAVVDVAQNAVVAEISVPFLGSHAAVATAADSAYVVTGLDEVAAIDISSKKVRKTFAVTNSKSNSPAPVGVALAPDGRSVYAVSSRTGSVSTLDASTGKIRKAIAAGDAAAGEAPVAVGVTPNGATLAIVIGQAPHSTGPEVTGRVVFASAYD